MKKIIIGVLALILCVVVVLVVLGKGSSKVEPVENESISQIKSEPIVIEEDESLEVEEFDFYSFMVVCTEGDPSKMEENLKAFETDNVKVNIKKIDVSKRDYFCLSGSVEEYDCKSDDDGKTVCDVVMAENKGNIDDYIKPGKSITLLKGTDDVPPCNGIIKDVNGDQVYINYEKYGSRTVTKGEFYQGHILVKK